MNTLLTTFTLALALAVTGIRVDAQSGYDLFSKALATERADGDLRAAIQLYERIVREFPGDRTLAARALVRIGECHEKLGQREAIAFYQRIVRDFADQAESASIARGRLAALDAGDRAGSSNDGGAGQFSTRRIWSEYVQYWGPSPDGRYLTFGELNNLYLRDTTNGTARQLTRGGIGPAGDGPQYPNDARFSRDGRSLAYGWKTPTGYQLRTIDVDGANERTITNNPEHEWLGPVDWSPDGTRLLAKINTRGNAGQIGWIAASAGAVQVLKTVPWTALGRLALSVDGRYIAYDQRSDGNPAARTIFVLSADGSRQVPVTDGSARDEVVGWLPDGGGLAYLSYRSGAPELRMVPMNNGVAAGAATILKRDLGAIQPLGFTKAGSLLYTQVVTTGDAYVASVDWDSGRITEPRKISTNVTADFGAAWSPDGSHIAYVAHRGTDLQRRVIAIHSVEDGSTREVVPADDLLIQTTGGHQWSPDGTAYLVNGTNAAHKSATFAVDLRSGRLRTLATFTNAYAQIPQWLAGGRSLIYVVRDQFKPSARVVVRDVDAGTERVIRHEFESETGAGVLASPDERTLAFVAGSGNRPPHIIHLLPLAGGPSRPLVDVPGYTLWPLAWTPDSQHLIYTRTNPSRNQAGNPRATSEAPERTVWLVPAAGGESRPLTFPHAPVGQFHIHPDGRQIAYTRAENQIEVWSVDRLSAATTASPRER